MEPERTPDGRYVVIDGRRWRASDPELPEAQRKALVSPCHDPQVEFLPALAIFLAGLVGVSAAILIWRDKRLGPACPACGRRNTFGPLGEDDLCSHCGLDLRSYDY